MLYLVIYLTIGAIDLAASYALIRYGIKRLKEERDINDVMFGSIIVVKLFLWPIDIAVIIRGICRLVSPDTHMEMQKECEETYESLFD